MFSYLLLVINIFLSVGGQFFLKHGVNSLTYQFNLPNLPKILFTPYVFLGFFLYGVSSILWIYILKNIPLSVAYPALSLGYILEKLGWKGIHKGNAGVFERQALVLINLGNASSGEIRELATQIMDDVYKKIGVQITPEIIFVE